MASQDRVNELSALLRRGQISRRGFVQSLLVLGISLPAALAFLEACGGPGAATSPTPTATNVTTLGKGSKEIKVWDGLGGPDGATFSSMLKAFTDANPDTRITHTVLEWSVYYQKIPTSILAGTPPDLIVNDAYGTPQFANRNMLQDLNDLVFGKNLLPKSDFPTGEISAGTWNGKLYAIPLWNPTLGFWFNTDLVRKAGLDPSNPPTNAAQFADWAIRMTKDTSGRRADQAGFDKNNVDQYGVSIGWFYHSLISALWQWGGDVYNDAHSVCTLDNPESIACLSYFVDLVKKGTHVPIVPPYLPATGQLYGSSKLGMVVEGGWWLGFFDQNKQLGPPVSQMNQIPQWGPRQKAVWYTAHNMSIPTGLSASRTALAAKLIAFLSDQSGPNAPLAGHLPARTSQQALPAVQTSWWLKPLSEQAQDHGRIEWYGPHYGQINDAFMAAWGSALLLQDSPESALKKAVPLINGVLAQK